MSDNSHYDYSVSAFSAADADASAEFNAACRDDAMIQATIALAYEQRTANLIAMWSKPQSSMGNVTWGVNEETVGTLLQEILERLGVKP